MFLNKLIVVCLSVVFLFSAQGFQNQAFGDVGKDAKLDSKTRAAVVGDIGQLLIEKYVFLDVAEKLRDHIHNRLKNGDYDTIDDPARFAMVLVEDLYQISEDRHFHIEFSPERAELIRAQRSRSKEEKEAAEKKYCEDDRGTNFGFKKLENLKGNIGYLDLRYFISSPLCLLLAHSTSGISAVNPIATSNLSLPQLTARPPGTHREPRTTSAPFKAVSRRCSSSG